MATLASPFETDAPRIRFSRHNSRFVAKSAQRFSGALTYDVKGNLVTRPASLQSPALSLVWDFDNKLRRADTNGTPATLEVTYEYDALGRRVARSGPGGNVVYFQAGQQAIADYPRGGAPASATYRYVYGAYVDEPLLRETVSGSVRHFFHRNQQHSVTALTDSAGNTAERYAYTTYGGLTVFNSSGIPQATSPLNNRYTYTGREWDDSTKLYHFRARWYDPAAGRFVGRDPLGFVDGMGLYLSAFVLSFLDPSGMRSQDGASIGFVRESPIGKSVDVQPPTNEAKKCHESGWKPQKHGDCKYPETARYEAIFTLVDLDRQEGCSKCRPITMHYPIGGEAPRGGDFKCSRRISWRIDCVCRNMPDNEVSNCVRGCIRCIYDHAGSPPNEEEHVWCFRKCGAGVENAIFGGQGKGLYETLARTIMCCALNDGTVVGASDGSKPCPGSEFVNEGQSNDWKNGLPITRASPDVSSYDCDQCGPPGYIPQQDCSGVK